MLDSVEGFRFMERVFVFNLQFLCQNNSTSYHVRLKLTPTSETSVGISYNKTVNVRMT